MPFHVKSFLRSKEKILIIIIFGIIFNDIPISVKNYFIILRNKNIKKYINEKDPNNLKVCLCVVCKEENLYIKEFVETYKKLGFNHIFIYDNNDINGEKLEEVINENVKEDFVTIINIRGHIGPQMDSYFDCYEKNNLIYDWLAFFDMDELLILKKVNNIQNFLMNPRYEYCEMIKINWKMITDNNKLDYENKFLKERFTEESKNNIGDNTVYKVIVRGNLSNYSMRKINNPHYMFTSNQSCDSMGNIRFEGFIKPPKYKFVQLNHYKKTIKEFCKKIKKGDVFYKKFEGNYFQFHFNDFFQYNKKTKEKVEIFNKELNVSFN